MDTDQDRKASFGKALEEARVEAGALSFRSTQEWAGHSNPAVTAGYTRTTKKRLSVVMEAIDYD